MADDLTDSELLILGLLAESPRSGSDIEELVTSRGIRNWTRIGTSSIYYLLKTLETRQFIEQTALIAGGKGKPRRVFSLTGLGMANAITATISTLSTVEMAPDPVLVGMANFMLVPDGEGIQALRERSSTLRFQLTELEALRDNDIRRPAFVAALFTHPIYQIRAQIDWLESTIDELAKETLMPKIDFRKASPELYSPSAKEFTRVTVPPLRYLMIDGTGDPNTAKEYQDALEALYPASYAIKFASKADGKDYTVGLLEGQWWSDDIKEFRNTPKSEWHWTMMIRQPEWMDEDRVQEILEATAAKKKLPLISELRFEILDEGDCIQIMHHGSYDDEAPTLARLHDEYLPSQGLRERGRHHEIYLSDPRRTSPERLKTVLRQPVAPLA